ncbi:MAG: alpha-galactosidase [Bacilli bacterium]|nr:alpha-galactosidase [Bacilli bacterium]
MKNSRYEIIYKVNGKKYLNESQFLKVKEISPLKLSIVPSTEVELVSARLFLDYDHSRKLYCNGYQTWTDTDVYTYGQKTRHMRFLGNLFDGVLGLKTMGDYRWCKQDKLVSHTYTYLQKDKDVLFYGALNENTGFYSFHFKKKLEIHKDVEKQLIKKETVLFNVFEAKAPTIDKCIDKYMKALKIPASDIPMVTGYTSWYRHYQNISEEKLLNDLKAIVDYPDYNPDLFQIDDGFETYVGDWLDVDKAKFPNGLKPVIDEITKANITPGIWLAPFVCEKKSKLRQEHPDWIIEKGGTNWSGMYHLDFTNPEVKAYLHEVFTHYKNIGFKFFKLDFLYAVASLPLKGKSRGELMYEAIDFLVKELEGCTILGCGVPLGSAFGKFKYCRIGPDVSLSWKGDWYMQLIHRERVSTEQAVVNAVARQHLDGKMFGNDPDVFILRSDVKMTEEERLKLFETNIHNGSLLFHSDDMSVYSQKEWDLIKKLEQDKKKRNSK